MKYLRKMLTKQTPPKNLLTDIISFIWSTCRKVYQPKLERHFKEETRADEIISICQKWVSATLSSLQLQKGPRNSAGFELQVQDCTSSCATAVLVWGLCSEPYPGIDLPEK